MRSKALIFILLLSLVFVVVGCEEETVGSNEVVNGNNDEVIEDNNVAKEDETVNESDEEVIEWSFVVDIVGVEEVVITNEDAVKIGVKQIVAAQKDGDSKLEEQEWTGILFVDLLDYLGIDEFAVISVEGADGSGRELDFDRMDKDASGFGWLVNGEKLDEKSGPVQLINNDRGPKWWVENVAKVTIIK